MTAAVSHKIVPNAAFESVVRNFAAIVPAVAVSYSLVVDPLINLGPVTDSVPGGDPDHGQKSTMLAQLLIPGLFAVLAFLSTIVRPRRLNSLWPVLVPLVAFLGAAIISSTWSVMTGRSLMLAIYQSLLCALLVLSVCISGDPEKIFRNIFWVFAFAMAINLLFVVLRPPGAIGHQGIYPYKNTLGSAAGCALIVALAHIASRRVFVRICALGTLVFAAAVLVASESKTAIALALAAPLAAFAALHLAARLHASAMIVMLGGLIGIVSAIVVASQVWSFGTDEVLSRIFGDPTFTGRTNIWAFITSHISDSPLIGHGYRGFWGVGELSPKLYSEIEFIRNTGSSHNGFLDIALDTGLIGTSLLALFVMTTLWSCSRAADGRGSAFLFLSIALFVLGRNTMESVILWSSFFDNLLFILAGLSAAYLQSERRQMVRYAQFIGVGAR